MGHCRRETSVRQTSLNLEHETARRSLPEPRELHDRGGAQQSVKSLAFKGSPILEGEEVYILNECPPAQSIGKTVMDKGYMFIWDPREQVPYLVPPSVVPSCKLRIPRKHRICASRVVEYVPQYDEEVTPVDFVPPDRLQPMGAVDASPASTNHEDSIFSDGELSTPSVADDVVSEPMDPDSDVSPKSNSSQSKGSIAAAPSTGAERVPPHPDDDKTLLEIADVELDGAPEALKAAAFEEPHILTHYPKNPYCPVCQISKSTSKRVARKPDTRDDDMLDPPKGPFEQLSTDDVIMAKGDDFAGKGTGGIAYPMVNRTASNHAKNFRHFLGLRANELASCVLIKMDEAGELEQAAHEVGLLPEVSLPNRWPHNATLERDIREEKECCRAVHMQSGLPYEFHTYSFPDACVSMSFDRPSMSDPAKTQYGRP